MLSEGTSTSRGRGRGRNRGKYLRSRGRRGAGRAAEFTPRLLLGEEQEDEDENESDDEGQGRYVKREIVDNAVKYAEPEIDPNVEEESDPEVDLSAFLAKQRLNAAEDPISRPLTVPDENDIDHSLSNLSLSTTGISKPRKNNVQTIEWDAALQKLKEDKEAADAVRDLKTRFRSSQSRPIRSQPRHGVSTMKVEDSRHIETLENEDVSHETTSKAQMEDFLDDLLS
ncbi:hypothetical protein Clacol_003508 [Clathrus columnatus]|uniref:Uncharacterized protein n=1 Tax=Clathrus columnatus TaxID=1419009 RepID=A0AAV5A3Q7_9AGAM|nr:hypothetical protein Clacol_003508 [Clathrus columnatus]